MQRYRRFFLRASKDQYDHLLRELAALLTVHAHGIGTVADPDSVWFEVLVTSPTTVSALRSLLGHHGLSDHVVRVDGLVKAGQGAVLARQTELFQGGPRAEPEPLAVPEPPRPRGLTPEQKTFLW